MKLYRVTTVVKEFKGCKDVTISWFRSHPTPGQRPYAELIEGYDPGGEYIAYPEWLIDELFTEEEAAQLKAYLDEANGHEGHTEIKERPLPVKNNECGLNSMAVGGGDDFLVIHERPDYPLPFKGNGYFNLVGCELIDGPGVFHHFLHIFDTRTGRLRPQTQEEAREAAQRTEAGAAGQSERSE